MEIDQNKVAIPKYLNFSVKSIRKGIIAIVKLFNIFNIKTLNNSTIRGNFNIFILICCFVSFRVFFGYFFSNEQAKLTSQKLPKNDGLYLYCGATEYCILEQEYDKDCVQRNFTEKILYNGDIFKIYKEDCLWTVTLINIDNLEAMLETLGYLEESQLVFLKNDIPKDESFSILKNETNYYNINYFANLEYLKLQFVSFTKNRDDTILNNNGGYLESWSVNIWKTFKKYNKCEQYIVDNYITCGAFRLNFNDNMFIIDFDTIMEFLKFLIFYLILINLLIRIASFNLKLINFRFYIHKQSEYEKVKFKQGSEK